jgi:hypothetical protein
MAPGWQTLAGGFLLPYRSDFTSPMPSAVHSQDGHAEPDRRCTLRSLPHTLCAAPADRSQ